MLAVTARTAEVKIRATRTPSIVFPNDHAVIQLTHSIKSEPDGKLKAAVLQVLYERFPAARNIKWGRAAANCARSQTRLDFVQNALCDGQNVCCPGFGKGQPY